MPVGRRSGARSAGRQPPGSTDAVDAAAAGELDGTTIAVSAVVDSVAIGQIGGVPVAVSGSHDNTVRIWSLADPDRAS